MLPRLQVDSTIFRNARKRMIPQLRPQTLVQLSYA